MGRIKRGLGRLAALGALAVLAGCDVATMAERSNSVAATSWGDRMRARQVAVVRPPVLAPSRPDNALKAYYTQLQADLLARGYLRTDDGSMDVPFDSDTLMRDFMAIALREEYQRGKGLTRSDGTHTTLARWEQPIRVSAEYGPSVPAYQSRQDGAILADYVTRLSQITGHPMKISTNQPNFHVLFMGEDDLPMVGPRVSQLVPRVNPDTLRLFDRLPRAVQCLVLAFPASPDASDYGTVIALIRSELPPLMRRACIHEEVAQGLGLGNDSPEVRPSIFNDDDEFALLTVHDAALLQILYDPALQPGMTAQEAEPLVRVLATALVPGAMG